MLLLDSSGLHRFEVSECLACLAFAVAVENGLPRRCAALVTKERGDMPACHRPKVDASGEESIVQAERFDEA